MYVCVTESLCCTTGINTINQLNFNKNKKKKKPFALPQPPRFETLM